MTESRQLDPQARFIEASGLRWEAEGLPRIAGRITAFLMLREEPASLDEMATTLGVSKASVSTDARRLEQLGLLRRIDQPGDRRDYYAIAEDAAIQAIEFKIESMRRMTGTFSELEPDQLPPAIRRRLDNFARTHLRIIAALEHLLDELRLADADAAPAHHTAADQ